jgi:hypothetical protein
MLSNRKYLQIAEVPDEVAAFDLIHDPNTFSTDIYAVKSGGTTRPIVELKIPEVQKFQHYKDYMFEGSCADMVQAGIYVVVVACSENGDVFVYRKNGPQPMKLVHKVDGQLLNNQYTTDNIAIIEKRGVFVD